MKIHATALLALTLLGGAAGADEPTRSPLDLQGTFWIDTGYLDRANAQAGQYDQVANYMQGRFILAGTYTARLGEYYAAARLELLGLVNEYAKSQYEPHTLDAYVRAGHARWDVTVGRFLAWEVYYRGQGIELYTAEEAGALGAPTLYLLDFTRGHKNEAGQAAIHVYPFDFLAFELAGVYGQENNQNCVGFRPVASVTVGPARLIGGFEYLRQVPQTEADKVEGTSMGAAGRLEVAILPSIVVGADVSWADIERLDIQGLMDTDHTLNKVSVGGFADIGFWKSSVGLGYHRTMQDNEQGEANTHDQLFVSYLQRLPIEGLSLKAVYGFARGHIEDVDTGAEWENDMHSFRVRALFELD